MAVEAFLQRRIRFTDIARMIESVLNARPVRAVEALDAVFEADAQARAGCSMASCALMKPLLRWRVSELERPRRAGEVK